MLHTKSKTRQTSLSTAFSGIRSINAACQCTRCSISTGRLRGAVARRCAPDFAFVRRPAFTSSTIFFFSATGHFHLPPCSTFAFRSIARILFGGIFISLASCTAVNIFMVFSVSGGTSSVLPCCTYRTDPQEESTHHSQRGGADCVRAPVRGGTHNARARRASARVRT